MSVKDLGNEVNLSGHVIAIIGCTHRPKEIVRPRRLRKRLPLSAQRTPVFVLSRCHLSLTAKLRRFLDPLLVTRSAGARFA